LWYVYSDYAIDRAGSYQALPISLGIRYDLPFLDGNAYPSHTSQDADSDHVRKTAHRIEQRRILI